MLSWCRWKYSAVYGLRSLSLWQSATCPEYKAIENIFEPIADKLPQEVTRVVHGVGFVVAYAPTQVWIASTIPSVSTVSGWGTRNAFRRVPLPEGTTVRELTAGREHVFVLTNKGEALSFGSNVYGQCGRLPTTKSGSPLEWHTVTDLPSLQQIRTGFDHTLFLSSDGRTFACGWSGDGQTGVGHYDSVNSPKPVVNLGEVQSLYTCADNSFAVTGSGEVYAWGNNEYGQLGIDSTSPQLHTAAKVNLSILDGRVVSIVPGGAFTTFLTDSGSVFYCGYGLGPETSYMVKPSSLSKLRRIWNSSDGKIKFLKASLHYVIASMDGITWMLWGRFPGKKLPPSIYSYSLPHKFSLPGCSQVACGSTSITALFNEAAPSQPLPSDAVTKKVLG